MKKIFNERVLKWATILLIILQPIIDMDYLLYNLLDKFGLPRFSTIVRFIIIPVLIIWTFFLKDKNKKKTIIFGLIYGVCLAAFFVLHCKQASALYSVLDFTTNFKFTIFQELTYVLTLCLPYGIIYVIYNMHFDQTVIKRIVLTVSSIISWPIFIGDLFVFGRSTYYGNTVANFISWFSGIYEAYHPRTLASKFFFNEGNTMGILLFMLLPILYYLFAKETNKKTKRYIVILILIQSLSMQILATRVATYGAVITPLVFVGLYLFDKLINHDKFGDHKVKAYFKSLNLPTIIIPLCCVAIFASLLPFTPAVVNQKVDNSNDTALLDNGAVSEGLTNLKDGEALIPGTKEYNDFYIFMFEQYGVRARYITSVPSMYYIDYYNYKFDPKFWVDVTFMDPYDRVSGRQIQTIFMNYKYQKLSSTDKLLGMGYSTFMNGSIVLEQDFKQQIYTLGYVGELLCVLPWAFVALYGVYVVIRKWKKMADLQTFTLAFSLVMGFACAYTSGHTLDQFVSTIFMAFIVGILLNKCHDAMKKENNNE